MNRELLSSETARFRATPLLDGTTLRLTLEGEADLEATDALGKILDGAHHEAQRLQTKEVAVDLTRLEFLSSSGVKHFITWLRNASLLQGDTSYRIRLMSSRLVPWQRRTLAALTCFAPTILTINDVGSAAPPAS